MSQVIEIWIDGKDGLSRPAQAGSRALKDMGVAAAQSNSALKSIVTTAAGVAAGMLALAGAQRLFGGLSDSIIGFNASMEQSRIAWSTMLKSTEAADAMLRDLQLFAAKTPFEFPELERSSKKLLAMGFAAKDIIPIMTDVGNAAAALGMGTEGVGRLTLALGQMRAKSKVSGEEMRQLAEAGIPAWQILAEAVGKPIPEVMKLSEQGKIAAGTFIDAFREFSQQNWGGMMDAQSKTFLGALSTIKDTLMMTAAAAFEPLFKKISALALDFSEFAQSNEMKAWADNTRRALTLVLRGFEGVSGAIGGLGSLVQQYLPVFAGLAAMMGVYVARTVALRVASLAAAAATKVLAAAQAALNVIMAMNPITAVIAVIAGLVTAFVVAYNTSEEFRNKVDESFKAVQQTVSDVVGKVQEFLGNLGKVVDGFVRGWRENFANVQKITADVFNAVGNALNTFFDWLKKLPIVGGYIKDFGDFVGIGIEKVTETTDAMAKNLGDTLGGVGKTVGTVMGQAGEKIGEGLGAAGEAIGTGIGNLRKMGEDALNQLRASWDNLALDPTADMDLNALAEQVEQVGNAAEAVGKKAKGAAVSIGQLRDSLIAVHPATIAAASAVSYWQSQIASVNLALSANADQLRAAQAEYDNLASSLRNAQGAYGEMQERLRELNGQLSEQQQKLRDLSAPQLEGMGEMDKQIAAVERQLKRLQMAETNLPSLDELRKQMTRRVRIYAADGSRYLEMMQETGDAEAVLAQMRQTALNQVLTQYPEMTDEMRAYLSTLPMTSEGLKQVLEQLRLSKDLKFDEALAKIKEAAEGVKDELTFEDALKQIADTKTNIDNLTGAISDQEAAMRAQQAAIDSINRSMENQQGVIKSIQAAADALNLTLQQYQKELAASERRQDLINQALGIAYDWFLDDRRAMMEMGGEAVTQAGIIDAKTLELLQSVTNAASDSSTISTETLAAMVSAYQRDTATAIGSVADLIMKINEIPDRTVFIDVITRYGTEGTPAATGAAAVAAPVVPGFQHGGAFMVPGSGGPDSQLVQFKASPREFVSISPPGQQGAAGGFVWTGDLVVQGTVLTERNLVETVRRGLIKVKESNVTSGA